MFSNKVHKIYDLSDSLLKISPMYAAVLRSLFSPFFCSFPLESSPLLTYFGIFPLILDVSTVLISNDTRCLTALFSEVTFPSFVFVRTIADLIRPSLLFINSSMFPISTFDVVNSRL